MNMILVIFLAQMKNVQYLAEINFKYKNDNIQNIDKK